MYTYNLWKQNLNTISKTNSINKRPKWALYRASIWRRLIPKTVQSVKNVVLESDQKQHFFPHAIRLFLWNQYSDDSLIRTRLFPLEISGLTSFPDCWITQVRTLANL